MTTSEGTAHHPVGKHASDIMTFPELYHQDGSIGYLEKMLIGELLLMSQPKLVIETGAYWGQTTRFLAEFVKVNWIPDCRIVSFDLPSVIDDLLRASPDLRDHQGIEFVAGSLPESLNGFLARSPQPVDFAVIDAEHSYTAVTQELTALHPCLKPGAYVFCHDYREGDARYEGVIHAVDRFVRSHGYDMLALNPSAWQGGELIWGAALLRKPRVPLSLRKVVQVRLRALTPRFVRKAYRKFLGFVVSR